MQGRFELKFVIDGETKERFLDAVKENLGADPHGENAVYRVSSLYFDTHDYRAVWEKLDGESIRRKFRLRYYSMDEADPKKLHALATSFPTPSWKLSIESTIRSTNNEPN